jgi:hypothetical protein
MYTLQIGGLVANGACMNPTMHAYESNNLLAIALYIPSLACIRQPLCRTLHLCTYINTLGESKSDSLNPIFKPVLWMPVQLMVFTSANPIPRLRALDMKETFLALTSPSPTLYRGA